MIAFADGCRVVRVEKQVLQAEEELVAACDHIGRFNDRRQRGLVQEFGERVEVVGIERGDFAQNGSQLLRIATDRVAQQRQGQPRAGPVPLRDVRAHRPGNHVEDRAFRLLGIGLGVVVIRIDADRLPVVDLFPAPLPPPDREMPPDSLACRAPHIVGRRGGRAAESRPVDEVRRVGPGDVGGERELTLHVRTVLLVGDMLFVGAVINRAMPARAPLDDPKQQSAAIQGRRRLLDDLLRRVERAAVVTEPQPRTVHQERREMGSEHRQGDLRLQCVEGTLIVVVGAERRPVFVGLHGSECQRKTLRAVRRPSMVTSRPRPATSWARLHQ